MNPGQLARICRRLAATIPIGAVHRLGSWSCHSRWCTSISSDGFRCWFRPAGLRRTPIRKTGRPHPAWRRWVEAVPWQRTKPCRSLSGLDIFWISGFKEGEERARVPRIGRRTTPAIPIGAVQWHRSASETAPIVLGIRKANRQLGISYLAVFPGIQQNRSILTQSFLRRPQTQQPQTP